MLVNAYNAKLKLAFFLLLHIKLRFFLNIFSLLDD